MKTKRNLIIGCMTLLCSACSNYLDIKPYGRTIPKTAEEFSALIHNRLNTIDEGSDRYLVGNASQYITWDAACGDDFETCLTGSGARSLDTYVGNIVGTSSYQSYYQTLYEYIRDCNIVLNEMKETGTKNLTKSVQQPMPYAVYPTTSCCVSSAKLRAPANSTNSSECPLSPLSIWRKKLCAAACR